MSPDCRVCGHHTEDLSLVGKQCTLTRTVEDYSQYVPGHMEGEKWIRGHFPEIRCRGTYQATSSELSLLRQASRTKQGETNAAQKAAAKERRREKFSHPPQDRSPRQRSRRRF